MQVNVRRLLAELTAGLCQLCSHVHVYLEATAPQLHVLLPVNTAAINVQTGPTKSPCCVRLPLGLQDIWGW